MFTIHSATIIYIKFACFPYIIKDTKIYNLIDKYFLRDSKFIIYTIMSPSLVLSTKERSVSQVPLVAAQLPDITSTVMSEYYKN